MSRLTASRAAFDLIASFEGFRTRAVLAPGGKWTLGFGHTATAREGLNVTRAEAEDLLRWDLLPIEDSLRQVALTPLTQNQFDALLSFAFNIGLENFKKSEVLKYLNQGQPIAAALSMHAWRRARVNGRVLTIDALVRRRAAEAALFLEPVGARAAAPTSIVAPEVDLGANVSFFTQEGPQDEKPATEVEAKPSEAPTPVPQVAPDLKPEPAAKPIGLPPVTTPPVTTPPVTIPQATIQDVLRQPLPPPPTPQVKPAFKPEPLSAAPVNLPLAKPKIGPILPEGIAPFPEGPMFASNSQAANTNGESPVQNLPANDGYNTRLHAAPEAVDAPSGSAIARPKPKSKPVSQRIDWQALVPWITLALGAALLAFGLFYAWKSGILSVSGDKREPTSGELSALLAAASGFIMLVTGGVATIAGQRTNEDADVD
jgi:lysozyme